MAKIAQALLSVGIAWFVVGLGVAAIVPPDTRGFIGQVAVAGWFVAAIGIVVHLLSLELRGLKGIAIGFAAVATGAGLELIFGETPWTRGLVAGGGVLMGVAVLVGIWEVLRRRV